MAKRSDEGKWQVRELGHSELVQMRIRIIALETVTSALLETASDEQRTAVAKAAQNIRSRPDANRHPLTEFAADEVELMLKKGAS